MCFRKFQALYRKKMKKKNSKFGLTLRENILSKKIIGFYLPSQLLVGKMLKSQ